MKYIKLTKISAVENPEYKTPSFDEYNRKKDTNERMSIPVEYTVEGYLKEDVEVGEHVVIERIKRNGLKCFGIMTTSPVTEITDDGFKTLNSIYKLELIAPDEKR
jgi:hypothetical protein